MHSLAAEVEAGESGPKGLVRHLRAVPLASIGIGAIIGAGIFVITGQAAATCAGPAIMISFIIAAFVCVFAGLCYAELASIIPIAGGAYSYAYVALGEFAAWLIGWTAVIQYLASSCTVAVGWSSYLMSVLKDFGFTMSPLLTHAPFIYTPDAGWHVSGALINIPAMVLVFAVCMMIATGIRAAATMNNVMVGVKLLTIFFFIVFGIAYINPSNLTPFIPQNTGVFGEFGWSGVLRGAGLVFFAYNGFDTVSTLAQETINPQKNIPRGMMGALGVSTIAYIATVLVMTGVVSYTLLNVADPVSLVLNAMGPNFIWFGFIVKIAILVALSSVVLVQLLGQTRIFFAMSQDGLLPRRLGHVHPKLRTPVFATGLIAVVGAVIAGLFPVDMLAQLVSLSVLAIFSIVCFGVLILRYTQPDLHRPFKVPFVPYVPAFGILCCVGQMFFLPMTTWVQLAIWLLIGLLVYFRYGFKHSKLRKKG